MGRRHILSPSLTEGFVRLRISYAFHSRLTLSRTTPSLSLHPLLTARSRMSCHYPLSWFVCYVFIPSQVSSVRCRYISLFWSTGLATCCAPAPVLCSTMIAITTWDGVEESVLYSTYEGVRRAVLPIRFEHVVDLFD